MLLQPIQHQLFHDIVDHGEHRHADQNADKSEKPAEHSDGKQYPEAGKSGAVCQQVRSQDVSVKLLENDDKNDEPHAFDRVAHQDQQRGRHGSDIRSKVGDDVCDAHNDAHQHRIREAEDQREYIAEQPDDRAVKNFSAENPTNIRSA